MTITDLAPANTERIFPTCAPWCAFHWAEDTEAAPGSCWAEDVNIPGAVEVMATWDEQRTARVYTWPNGTGERAEPVITEEPAPPLSITVFRADVPLDEGISFTSLEQAEACAHALLAMVSRIRGEEQLAAVHLAAGGVQVDGINLKHALTPLYGRVPCVGLETRCGNDGPTVVFAADVTCPQCVALMAEQDGGPR